MYKHILFVVLELSYVTYVPKPLCPYSKHVVPKKKEKSTHYTIKIVKKKRLVRA